MKPVLVWPPNGGPSTGPPRRKADSPDNHRNVDFERCRRAPQVPSGPDSRCKRLRAGRGRQSSRRPLHPIAVAGSSSCGISSRGRVEHLRQQVASVVRRRNRRRRVKYISRSRGGSQVRGCPRGPSRCMPNGFHSPRHATVRPCCYSPVPSMREQRLRGTHRRAHRGWDTLIEISGRGCRPGRPASAGA